MSKDLGPQLPQRLVDALRDEDVTHARGRAILVVTLDDQGWPHPALLSYREVGVLNETALRLVTYEGTATTKSLRTIGKVTLVFVDERFSYYVKGTASSIAAGGVSAAAGGDSGLAYFDVSVDRVLEDEPGADEQGAYITSGVEFHNPWDTPRRVAQDR